jgi:hypothetical protein
MAFSFEKGFGKLQTRKAKRSYEASVNVLAFFVEYPKG